MTKYVLYSTLCTTWSEYTTSEDKEDEIMSLIKCPECGKEISDKAPACIYCGYPINAECNINALKDFVENMFQSDYWYQHWGDLYEYLDKIATNSSGGLKTVQELLRKNGIYEIAEERIRHRVCFDQEISIEKRNKYNVVEYLLTRYDTKNFLGWFLKWKRSPFNNLIAGDNAIKYSTSPQKEICEKEIYLYRIQAYGSPKLEDCPGEIRVSAIRSIPKQYVNDNIFIQNAIIEKLNSNDTGDYEYNKYNIKAELRNLLPPNRSYEKIENTKIANTTNTSNDGCYIATCVYESYNCPEVWTLRRFRDYKLKTTWCGKLFVKCYYTISPTIVKLFGNTMCFKIVWKKILDKMVHMLNNHGFENTPYEDK